MSAKRFHLRVDLRGALLNRAFDCFRHDDGRPMHPDEARSEIRSLLARGVKFVPVGECEGFYPEGRCPGHPMEEEPGP